MQLETALPCPCCGSTQLTIGPTDAQGFGVQCQACGLRMRRSLPDRWPPGTRRLPIEERIAYVNALLTNRAIQAWNKRTQ